MLFRIDMYNKLEKVNLLEWDRVTP